MRNALITIDSAQSFYLLPANHIKQHLHKQGKTLKSWAAENGFSYRTVCDVVQGIRRGYFGEGRKVRIALGLPVAD